MAVCQDNLTEIVKFSYDCEEDLGDPILYVHRKYVVAKAGLDPSGTLPRTRAVAMQIASPGGQFDQQKFDRAMEYAKGAIKPAYDHFMIQNQCEGTGPLADQMRQYKAIELFDPITCDHGCSAEATAIRSCCSSHCAVAGKEP